MATIGTIEITAVNICAGDHYDVTVDLNSGERVEVFEAETLKELIGPVNQDDVKSFLKILLKLGMRGRTKAAAKTLLQGGVNVTVDASPV